MAENIRNPFNPMRFTGRNGMLTVEEASRLQDLIRTQGGDLIRTLNTIINQLGISITNVAQQPGPQGAQGIPGLDGTDGADSFVPGPPGARGAAGLFVPGIDGADGQDGERGAPGRDGARGTDGVGVPGMDGADGTDGRPGPPGPQGPAGRDGAIMLGDGDAPEPLFVPPRSHRPAPFVLHLGYGPTNFDGTLPAFAEGSPHFWLHPFTDINNVSAIIVGSSHTNLPIEWIVREAYTFLELEIYVRTASLSTDGTGTVRLDVTVSKNGTDLTGAAFPVQIVASETDEEHYASAQVSVAPGDRIGIHVTGVHFGSGSLVAHFIARLT